MSFSRIREFHRQYVRDSGILMGIIDGIQETQPLNTSGTRSLQALFPIDAPTPELRSLSYHGATYHVIDEVPGTDRCKTLAVVEGDVITQEIDIRDGLIRLIAERPGYTNNHTGVLFRGSGMPNFDAIRYGSSPAPSQIGAILKRFGQM